MLRVSFFSVQNYRLYKGGTTSKFGKAPFAGTPEASINHPKQVDRTNQQPYNESHWKKL